MFYPCFKLKDSLAIKKEYLTFERPDPFTRVLNPLDVYWTHPSLPYDTKPLRGASQLSVSHLVPYGLPVRHPRSGRPGAEVEMSGTLVLQLYTKLQPPPIFTPFGQHPHPCFLLAPHFSPPMHPCLSISSPRFMTMPYIPITSHNEACACSSVFLCLVSLS